MNGDAVVCSPFVESPLIHWIRAGGSEWIAGEGGAGYVCSLTFGHHVFHTAHYSMLKLKKDGSVDLFEAQERSGDHWLAATFPTVEWAVRWALAYVLEGTVHRTYLIAHEYADGTALATDRRGKGPYPLLIGDEQVGVFTREIGAHVGSDVMRGSFDEIIVTYTSRDGEPLMPQVELRGW